MMVQSSKADFLKVTSWMGENVMLAAGVYRTTQHTISIDPVLYLEEDGSVARKSRFGEKPPEFDGWLMSSVAALTCCCYIDALGKVMLRGGGPNRARFSEFITTYMTDFIDECNRRGPPYSIDLLYKMVRCGFVHQFARENLAWTRSFHILSREYWVPLKRQPGQEELFCLNIDHLNRGFLRGLVQFRADFADAVDRGQHTYDSFFEWLGKT